MTTNALYLQSGGPTAVINASAYGVIQECLRHPEDIGTLYGVRHGMVGLLRGELIDVRSLEPSQLGLLPQTPSMAFGSCRYRIPEGDAGAADYDRILDVLRKHRIGHLYVNGGNVSSPTAF